MAGLFGGSTPFGQAQQGSAFGAPPAFGAAGGAFGQQQQQQQQQQQPSLFGAPGGAGQTPSFGQTPAFGQTPSFGQAPAFGATGGAFGQSPSSQPSLFGTPSAAAATAASPFGGAASSSTLPAFGQSPSAFGAFGATGGAPTSAFGSSPSPLGTPQAFSGFGLGAQSTSSLFGASTSPSLFGGGAGAAGTPGGSSSLFGAPAAGTGAGASLFGAAPSQPGSTPLPSFGSPFGTTGTPASTPSLFGAPAATAATTGGGAASPFSSSLFGTSSPFGTPGMGAVGAMGTMGAMGAPQGQMMQQGQILQSLMMPAVPGASAQPQADVNFLVQGYNAAVCGTPGGGKGAAFCYGFFNITHTMLSRLRPENVPDPVWNELMAKLRSLPEDQRQFLCPEIVWGFPGLKDRLLLQDEAMKEDKERLEQMEVVVGQMKARLDSLIASRANQARQKQQQLQQRLLRVMHIVEVLSLRGFSSPLTYREMELLEHLRGLIQAVKGSAEIPRRVDTVAAAAQEQGMECGLPTSKGSLLDASSQDQLFELIKSQSEAIAKLVATAQSDSAALDIISNSS